MDFSAGMIGLVGVFGGVIIVLTSLVNESATSTARALTDEVRCSTSCRPAGSSGPPRRPRSSRGCSAAIATGTEVAAMISL